MAEERDLAIGGNRLHIRIEGRSDGPWLTLLHGAATNLHLWDPQIAFLAPIFRLLRIDVRGHGGSSADQPSTTFDKLVADVIAVWDALGIERSSVMGLSLGGMTGFGLAIDHPDRIDRLVAADCRADAPDFSIFQRGQELRLERQLEVADLIEEEGAPVRLFEEPAVGVLCAGEGAAVVAEDLGFEEGRRDPGAVHRHEGRSGAGGRLVDRSGHQPLPGAGLAGEEHWRIDGGCPGRGLPHTRHGGAPAQDVGERHGHLRWGAGSRSARGDAMGR